MMLVVLAELAIMVVEQAIVAVELDVSRGDSSVPRGTFFEAGCGGWRNRRSEWRRGIGMGARL